MQRDVIVGQALGTYTCKHRHPKYSDRGVPLRLFVTSLRDCGCAFVGFLLVHSCPLVRLFVTRDSVTEAQQENNSREVHSAKHCNFQTHMTQHAWHVAARDACNGSLQVHCVTYTTGCPPASCFAPFKSSFENRHVEPPPPSCCHQTWINTCDTPLISSHAPRQPPVCMHTCMHVVAVEHQRQAPRALLRSLKRKQNRCKLKFKSEKAVSRRNYV